MDPHCLVSVLMTRHGFGDTSFFSFTPQCYRPWKVTFFLSALGSLPPFPFFPCSLLGHFLSPVLLCSPLRSANSLKPQKHVNANVILRAYGLPSSVLWNCYSGISTRPVIWSYLSPRPPICAIKTADPMYGLQRPNPFFLRIGLPYSSYARQSGSGYCVPFDLSLPPPQHSHFRRQCPDSFSGRQFPLQTNPLFSFFCPLSFLCAASPFARRGALLPL